MSTEGFRQMLAALEWAMPGWSSFDDFRLQSREIQYKRKASREAKHLLEKSMFERLISERKWDEILRRLEEIGKKTNLLWNEVPPLGEMSVLFAPNMDKEGYTRQVYDLLFGPGDSTERFARYVAYVETQELPNRWPFPTYLLFLFHPETDIFVKPSVTEWFLHQAGEEQPWQSQPSAELYERIKCHSRRFGDFLSSYRPTDMIDIQSAIYMAKAEMERMCSPAVWWVNQGVTYRAERDGGFLWAPLKNKAGRTEFHWDTMAEVRPGDVVLHYANNALRAVSRVTEAATLRPAPPEVARSEWESDGRYVKTEYTHFDKPIPIDIVVAHEEVRSIPRGPITARSGVKQGYLFPFTVAALAKVVAGSSVEWPDYVLDLVGGSSTSTTWIFQATPDRYDVVGAVTNLDEITWTLNQYANQVRAGDTVYIWESGENAGIIAIGKVLSDPTDIPMLEKERPYVRDFDLLGSPSVPRVRVRVERILPSRVTRKQLKQHPVLAQMTIIRRPQGTVFRVTPEQAAALDDLIHGRYQADKVTNRAVRISVPLARWQTYRDCGYISVGWLEVGDLLQYNSLEEIITAVERYLIDEYPTGRQRENVARQLWLFRSLQPGDQVIATSGTSAILAVGRVNEPAYSWEGAENGRGHWVPVTWDDSVARRVSRQAQWRAAVIDEVDSSLVELARTPGPGLPEPVLDLEAVCREFAAALRGSHISFGPRHDEVVRSFVVSLATKRFVILTGLSGSGKTQLAVRFGEWLGPGRKEVVAVRPDWTGPEPLFGYEDALQEPVNGRRPWHVPKALEFMLKAARDPEYPYLLVLDEMNLAHVERYFADLLSGMESDEPVLPNLIRDEESGRWIPDPCGPDRIPIPENLFVVGTVNVDETTYMFSPKVLDRANTIEFRVDTEDLSEWMRRPTPIERGDPALVRGFLAIATDPDWHLQQGGVDLSQFMQYLRKLHRILAGSHVEFGHRVVYEANRFASLLAAAGEADLLVALDLQVLQKVLPRVHGSRKRIEPVLRALGRFCFDPGQPVEESSASASTFDPEQPPSGVPKLPRSFAKVQRMVRILRADQFVSFAE